MNLLKTFLIALIGGLVVFAGIEIFEKSDKDNATISYRKNGKVQQAFYTMNKEGEIVPVDFTVTAEKVSNSVVHIIPYGTPSFERGPQQLPDPFREFFEDYFQQQQPPEQEQRPMGSGSGVIINSDGYIVTNFHVIRNAEKLEVTTHDNQSYEAEVMGTDPTTDLALLKIEENGLNALTMVNSDNIEVGEWVLAVGNPFNLTSTVTAGIISATSRQINILREQYSVESFLQTDAAINPGNSGGALVNLNGELIGINTAIASPTGSYSGYGFAVPSNIVNKVVSDLLKFGEVKRAILGISIRNVNSNLAEEEDLDITTGVYVNEVGEGSAAEKGGMKKGDIIVAVDGEEVVNSGNLQARILQHTPGEKVNLTIRRNGETRNLDITLGSLKESTARQISGAENEILRDLGVQLRTLSSAQARELDIEGGVLVEKLYPGKLSRETQMKEGFIITAIDKKEVTSVKDFVETIKVLEGGILIEGFYPGEMRKRYYGLSLSG